MIRQVQDPLLEVWVPASGWIRPETLVDLTVEGRDIHALADSDSQVNTITPALVLQYGFPVLLLEGLIHYECLGDGIHGTKNRIKHSKALFLKKGDQRMSGSQFLYVTICSLLHLIIALHLLCCFFTFFCLFNYVQKSHEHW